MTDNILIQRSILFLNRSDKKSAEMKEETKNISKHKKRLSESDTSCMVTFTSSATRAAHCNPPVSSRPDPVWRERMWDTYTHISSYYMAGNIFSLGDGVKLWELLLKHASS